MDRELHGLLYVKRLKVSEREKAEERGGKREKDL